MCIWVFDWSSGWVLYSKNDWDRQTFRGIAHKKPNSSKRLICLSKYSPNMKPIHINYTNMCALSGTGDSQRDSRESIRANHSQLKPQFFTVRQADSHESLEFPIRAHHPIRANRANRFARITPLSVCLILFLLYFLIIDLGAGPCNFEFEHIQCTEAPNKQEAKKGRLASLLIHCFGSPMLQLRLLGLTLWKKNVPLLHRNTETQKEDPKVTQKWLGQTNPKVTQKWLRTLFWVIFELILSHLGSLWGGTPGATFESLLGHFKSFCVSVRLGGHPLRKINQLIQSLKIKVLAVMFYVGHAFFSSRCVCVCCD